MDKLPILSICIPIYNRELYLRRHFEQFMKCKSLFDEKIHLYISDNCSKDDLFSISEEYRSRGLNFEYSRNETNLGADRNFIKCFNNAKGKYIWLLGSDDIPVDGFIESLVDILERKDYCYLFLNHNNNSAILEEFNDATVVFERIHVWITFLSANIIRTELVKNVNGEDYLDTHLIQVPYFLESLLALKTCAIYNIQWFQNENDAANNGHYDFFQVFVDNLLNIIFEKVQSGQMSLQCYQKIKKSIYCNFVVDFVIKLLFLRNQNLVNNFQTDHPWKILSKHYSKYPYFYYYTFKKLMASWLYNICN